MLKFLWITSAIALISSCHAAERHIRAINSNSKGEFSGYEYPPPSLAFTLPPPSVSKQSFVTSSSPANYFQSRSTSSPQNIVNSYEFPKPEKPFQLSKPIKPLLSNTQQQPISSGQQSVGLAYQNPLKPIIQQKIIPAPSISPVFNKIPLTQQRPGEQSIDFVHQNLQKPSLQQSSISRPSTSLLPSNILSTNQNILTPGQQLVGNVYQNQRKPSLQESNISRPSTLLLSNTSVNQKKTPTLEQKFAGYTYPQIETKPVPEINKPTQASGYNYPKPEKQLTFTSQKPAQFSSPRPSEVYSTTGKLIIPEIQHTYTVYTTPKPSQSFPINLPVYTKPPQPPSLSPKFIPKPRPSNPSIPIQQNRFPSTSQYYTTKSHLIQTERPIASYVPPLPQRPLIPTDLNQISTINGPKTPSIQTSRKPNIPPFINVLQTTGRPIFESNTGLSSPPSQPLKPNYGIPTVLKPSIALTTTDSIYHKGSAQIGYDYSTKIPYLPPKTSITQGSPTPTYLPPSTTTTRRPPIPTTTTTRRPPIPTTTTTRRPPIPTTTTTRRPPIPTITTTRRPPIPTTTTRKPPTTTRKPPTTTPTTTRKPPTITPTKQRTTPVPSTTRSIYLPPSSRTPRPTTSEVITSSPTKNPIYLPPTQTQTEKPPNNTYLPPRQTTLPTSTSTSNQPTIKGPQYLPPRTPKPPNTITIKPPPPPPVVYKTTPSTSPYPLPTGRRESSPTLPPTTARTGYVYPIPDIQFYT